MTEERGFALRHAYTDDEAAARDAAPMVTRCAVDGCDWRIEATAGECRAAALEHRRKKHPHLRLTGVSPKRKPKASPQTDEDRRIVRDLDRRQRQSRCLLTPERVDVVQRRIEQGETLKAIAEDLAAGWGYRSLESFKHVASARLRDRGISPADIRRRLLSEAAAERRAAAPRRLPRRRTSIVTPERLAEAEARLAAGENRWQIATSVYREWGSKSPESVHVMLTTALRRRDRERRAA